MVLPMLARLLGAAAMLLAASPASAQVSLAPLTGLASGHLGTTAGADGSDAAFTFGGSVAVVEQSGWGAEIDFGHAAGEGGANRGAHVQSYMVNVTGVWPTGALRPFLVAGLGGLRVRACGVNCEGLVTWLDWGYSAGAGAHYLVNSRVALRGDVRYFSTLDNHPDAARRHRFDFWRVTVGASVLWDIVP